MFTRRQSVSRLPLQGRWVSVSEPGGVDRALTFTPVHPPLRPFRAPPLIGEANCPLKWHSDKRQFRLPLQGRWVSAANPEG